MAKCNFTMQVTGGICGIEWVEKAGEEKCYVHRCLSSNIKISNEEKFREFLKKHSNYFSNPKYAQEFKIGFEFDINNLGFSDIKFKNFKFYEKAKFEGFSLQKEVTFYNCVFFKEVTFEESDFLEKILDGYARGKELHHNIEKTVFKKECNFKNVVFNNVVFKDVDFPKCFFSGAEFNNCSFVNVKWAKIGKILGRKYAFSDENDLSRSCEDYIEKLSDLERIYRSLKAIAKSAEDRDMEGGFNYSENEMIRKRKPLYKQIFTSKYWYYLGSRYGERPSWAFINISLIIFVWSIFYAYSGIKFVENSEIIKNINFNIGVAFDIRWSDLPYLILHAMYPISLGKYAVSQNVWTQILSIFESALLATQIGLFVNALRRKLQR